MSSIARAALLVVIAGGIGLTFWLLAPNQPSLPDNSISMNDAHIMTLTSTAFNEGGVIPTKYTCDGENINPPFLISDVPEGVVSLSLLADDPDIPQVFKDQRGIDSFDHWTLFNIDPSISVIGEGEMPGTAGVNSAGNLVYTGPCPPTEYEPTEHRYFFKIYALDTQLNLPEGATKAEVLAAMEGHIIAEAQIMGVYDRAGGGE